MSAKYTTVKQLHAIWMKAVWGGEPLSPNQEEELRRAFYAGAAAMFHAQITEIPPMSYPEAELAFNSLRDEFDLFFKSLSSDGPSSGKN